MKRILFFLFITMFFTSCSSKNNAFKYFEKDNIETKGIHYTKKIDILKDKEIDIIFWATYLNKIDNNIKDSKKEVFLITLYFANSASQDINKNGYEFLLNGNDSVLLEKVEEDNENFKSLMLKNNWGNYYLVKFDSLEDVNNLRLVLTNQKSSKAILDFEK